MNIKAFKPFLTPFKEEIHQNIQDVLDTGFVLQGKYAKLCEDEIKQQTGSPYVLMTSSATTALEAIIIYLRQKHNIEIITPDVNYVSTPFIARRLSVNLKVRGRTDSGEIDITELPEADEIKGDDQKLGKFKINNKLQVVVETPLSGRVSEFYEANIKNLEANGYVVIEDASQCFLTGTTNDVVGAIAKYGVYSFCFNKFSTAGEGGCVLTKDQECYEFCRKYITFGKNQAHSNVFDMIGFNYRISEFSCGVLLSQLKYGAEIKQERLNVWIELWQSLKDDFEIVTTDFDNKTRFDILVKDEYERDYYRNQLYELYHIETPSPIYDFRISELPFLYIQDKPVIEKNWNRVLSLPCYPSLSDEEIEYIISSVKRIKNEIH